MSSEEEEGEAKFDSQSDWRSTNSLRPLRPLRLCVRIYMPHGLSVISVIWLPLKRRPLVQLDIKILSVRDKICSYVIMSKKLLCLTNYYVKKMKEKRNIWGMVLQATIGILSAIAAALGLQSCGFGV